MSNTIIGTTAQQTRLMKVQAALEPSGVDLLVLAVSDNLRYALGGYAPMGDERFCTLLLTPRQVVFVVPAVNAEQARMHVSVPIITFQDAEGPDAALAEALATIGATDAQSVAVDEEMRADSLFTLQAVCPKARYSRAGRVITALRSRKDGEEIRRLQAAAATADAGVEAVCAAIRPGSTELELTEVAGAAMRRAGADSVAFLDVAAAAHGALPHHHPGTYALRAGDVVIIDIGSRLQHYSSDITRVAVVGGAAPDPEYTKVHEVVERAVQAGIAAARPGALAREVDAAARGVIEAAGYGEYFVHRTGHGLGLSVHEHPYITSSSDTVLEEGMVFSIEPGIYFPGRFGVRLEEIVYLDAQGAQVLSRVPRAIRVV